MVGVITLTANDLSPGGRFDATTQVPPFNKLTKNLRNMQLQKRKMGLKKLELYYSWPNIRSVTSMTFSWKIGAAFSDFTWTLPANYNYSSVDVLNQALQTFCIANGLYLIDGNQNNVYYMELKKNAVSYKIELSLLLVPTSLPVAIPAWTQPSNFAGYPTVSCTPKLTINSDSELCNLIGFLPGTYDGGATATIFSSTYIPQFNPVSTIYVTCNLCKNDVPINGSTVISTFTVANTNYGSMIEVEPNSISYYEIDNNSQQLEVAFYDQNFNQLYILDPQINVLLEVS